MNAIDFFASIVSTKLWYKKETAWTRWRARFRAEVAQYKNITQFMTWDSIKEAPFFMHEHMPYIAAEAAALEAAGTLTQNAIAEYAFGSPTRLSYLPDTSANMVHNAYHLKIFEAATGVKISKLKSIVEIGAGYGVMYPIIHRLGFAGRYDIYDYLELLLLQQLYHDGTGLPPIIYSLVEDQGRFFVPPRNPDLLISTYLFNQIDQGLCYALWDSIAPKYALLIDENNALDVLRQKVHQTYTWACVSANAASEKAGTTVYTIGTRNDEC